MIAILNKAQESKGLGQEIHIIEPGSFSRRFWTDLWRYRELFFVLAWRDISVQYKQTIIGILWAIVRPFLTMIVFTVVFGRLAKLPSEAGAPYAILVFAGLLPWSLFATSLGDAGNSLINNSALVSKVYFPRAIVPAAAVVTALVDFLISLTVLIGMMIWYEFAPGWHILALPVFMGMAALAAFGPGLYFASMTVKYRDFRIVIPFVLQFGLYISPVGFGSTVVPEAWRSAYDMNPLVGIIDGFRWCILGGELLFPWQSVLIAAVLIALLLWIGISQFRRSEKSFVDTI
jgi:lipopolysaccharide transport system permease protein